MTDVSAPTPAPAPAPARQHIVVSAIGADRPGRELVDASFGDLAWAFHGPLLDRLEAFKA